MKRMFVAALLFIAFKSECQLLSCNTKAYAGIAPISIDGSIADWETILGASTGDPVFPFGSASTAYDTYGAGDPDQPESNIDIRVKTVAYDDNNVYFYFRRLDNANSSLKAFYFLDTNVDGLMSSGEPVIIIHFNSQNVQKLSLGYYIPVNPAGDPIGGTLAGTVCVIDGHTMEGTVKDLLNWKKVDLLANEIFDAAITEDGYGVELAIPWRLISPSKTFVYHLALQKGGGSYNADAVTDNAGGCNSLLNIVGSPDIEVSNVNVTTVTEGLSFRIDITFTNLTAATLQVNTTDYVSFTNIVQNDGLPIDETQFTVDINGLPYRYYDGTFSNQPIRYSNITTPGAGEVILQPFQTRTVSVLIGLPANRSVQSTQVVIQPKSKFFLELECLLNTGGGGKPTNPIGVPVGDATTTRSRSGQHHENEISAESLKEIILYPNPSSGRTTLLLPDHKRAYEIQLTDYTGRIIRKWQNVNPGRFDIETKQRGFYLLNIVSGSGVRYVKKLIVQ